MARRPRSKPSQLTARESRFVAAFLETGNATESARRAGYKGSDEQLAKVGSRLVLKVEVARAIADGAKTLEKASHWRREDRLAYARAIAEGEQPVTLGVTSKGRIVKGPAKASDRLRALELYAKMNGEFVDKSEAQIVVNAKSVHVVLTMPPSSLGPPPPADLQLPVEVKAIDG